MGCPLWPRRGVLWIHTVHLRTYWVVFNTYTLALSTAVARGVSAGTHAHAKSKAGLVKQYIVLFCEYVGLFCDFLGFI